MKLISSPRWRLELPNRVSLNLATYDDVVVARVGPGLQAFRGRDGELLWNVSLDTKASSGSFLLQAGTQVVTDWRPDPARTTQLVVCRDGHVTMRIQTGCIIAPDAAEIAGNVIHVIGSDPETGVVQRSFSLETGERIAHVGLANMGASSLVAYQTRLLICNRWGNPGLYWLSDSTREVVEEQPIQALAGWGARAITATGDNAIAMWDLASTTVLWTEQATYAPVAIDETRALIFDGGPVLCDVATGARRWQGDATAGGSGCWFSGPYVILPHLEGLTILDSGTGAKVAELDAYTAAYANGALYVGGPDFLERYDV